MTDADYGTFERAFRRLSGAFRLKVKPAELEELAKTYFKVLDAYPIDEVLLAGKTCLAKCRTFPKAADWFAELAGKHVERAPADARWMTVAEMDELARAAALRYEDQPCLCSECCRAGIDDRPLRFVSSLVGDDEERAFNSRRNALEVVGHWAHGDELAGWYRAREAFFALLRGWRQRQQIARVLVSATGEREPGEDDI